MYRYWILFVLIGVCVSQEESDEQYLVCKPFNRNASLHKSTLKLKKSTQETTSIPQGPPGPIGPPGPPGDSLNLDLFRGELDLQILNQVVRIFFNLKCYDGVLIDGYCYRLLYRVGYGLTHSQAKEMCEFHNGTLAELLDRRVFNTVYEYIKSSWSLVIGYEGERTLKVWLNSQYRNKMLFSRNGDEINYNIRWAEGFPIQHVSYQNIALEVATKPGARRDGLVNVYPGYSRPIPLCQFDINTYKNFVGLN